MDDRDIWIIFMHAAIASGLESEPAAREADKAMQELGRRYAPEYQH